MTATATKEETSRLATELADCPFCGNAGRELTPIVNEVKGPPWDHIFQAQIECQVCGARGPATAWYKSSEAALSKLVGMHDTEGWNVRAS